MSSTPQTKRRPPDFADGLPASIDTERLILGLILLDAGRYLATVRAQLVRDDFFLDKHKRIFQRALELDERGVKPDIVTLTEVLMAQKELDSCGGMDYLVSLDDGLPQIENIDAYIAIVKDKAMRRRVVFAARHLANLALRATEEIAGTIAKGVVLFGGLQADSGPKTETAPVVPVWPDPIGEEGFYGLAGELVRAIEPHTEADPAALLLQFLVGWGSLAGRGPYYLAEADRHHTNEYATIVGTTAKGRKGTSWGRILAVLRAVDPHWAENRQLAGLGSGEALIDAAGEDDHRTMVTESEFARLLAVVSREGSTISANLRNGWDTGTLAIRTRQNKVTVKEAHLSMITHITREELLRRLDNTETANGFGNRILWVCARRSNLLPHGGGSINYSGLLGRLEEATAFARKMGNTRVRFDNAASDLWERVYQELSEGQPGLLGSMTSRAEAHVVRLALIYALLDCADEIRVEHLRAALAVWRYCYDSARYIWGDALGDPTADEILRGLRAAAGDGLTRWDLVNLFSRNRPAAEIDRAIGVLAERGLIRSAREDTGGRASTRYWVV
jgi:hypothetical protein